MISPDSLSWRHFEVGFMRSATLRAGLRRKELFWRQPGVGCSPKAILIERVKFRVTMN
jgi:hypothetical protein